MTKAETIEKTQIIVDQSIQTFQPLYYMYQIKNKNIK